MVLIIGMVAAVAALSAALVGGVAYARGFPMMGGPLDRTAEPGRTAAPVAAGRGRITAQGTRDGWAA